MKRWIALCGALLLLLLPVWAGAKMPDPPTGKADTYVFDYADVISDADAQTMDDYADALNGETEAMAICVTVDFLDGMDSKDYAYDLFNSWGVGDKDRNDGVLLLFSRGDKAIEIAVGTGLENTLNDATTGQLLDDYAMSYLRDGDYSTGLREVFEQLCRKVAQSEGKTLSVAGATTATGNGSSGTGNASNYNGGNQGSYYDDYDNGYYDNDGGGFSVIGIVIGIIVLLVVANLIFGNRVRNGGCGNGCSGGGCLPGCLLGSMFGNLFGGGNNRNNRWPPSSGPRPPSGGGFGGFGGGGFGGGGGRSGGGGFGSGGGFGGGGRSGGGGFGGGGGRTGGGGAGRKF